MTKIIKLLLLVSLTACLSGCFIVTTPVKVAADTVHTAADVV